MLDPLSQQNLVHTIVLQPLEVQLADMKLASMHSWDQNACRVGRYDVWYDSGQDGHWV